MCSQTSVVNVDAGRYSAKIDDRPWNDLYERPMTLQILPTVDNIDVLDAGCGHGWYADWLARHGARVVSLSTAVPQWLLLRKSASQVAPA